LKLKEEKQKAKNEKRLLRCSDYWATSLC